MSSLPKRKFHVEENTDSWLMSYADMITLLLSFFIIFVSISEPKRDRFVAATAGMKERFGMLALETPYDNTYRNLVGVVASHNADRNIAVEKTSRGMQIEVSALQFFTPGTAEIPEEQLPLLKEVAKALKEGELVTYTIEVEGHTNDMPTTAKEFVTNWELAAARATRIVRLLVDEGIAPGRLRATSYAETKPAVPNEDEQGNPIPENREKNQRVIIRVEKDAK